DRYPATDGRRSLHEILEAALELERANSGEGFWNGWRWQEVRAQPGVLQQALLADLIRVNFQSRSQTCYLAQDPERLREALRAYSQAPASTPAPEDETANPRLPEGAFDVIVGHEPLKELIRRSLSSPRPVHVLLAGPPGTAKTLFLSDVAQVPGARYALGGATSRAGLLDYLLAQPTCRVLVYDELDKAPPTDQAALLSIMESGLVSRLKHGKAESERRQIWVVAGANRIEHMPAELLSRFAIREIAPYSAREFQRVVEGVLTRREQVDPEVAREIAHRLAGFTHDVRTAVRAARLCQGDRRQIPETLKLLGIFA
ncbi:MAG: AAA family ATPase, partial [Candidatus Dormibacteria bacterium]